MKKCPFCAEEIQDQAVKCKHCHESLVGDTAKWQKFRVRYNAMSRTDQGRAWNNLSASQKRVFGAIMAGKSNALEKPKPRKSNGVALLLGLLLGPVGLWYKGHWVAGFAWLVMAVIIMIPTYGLAAPVFWIGMAIHAAAAEPRT